MSDNAAILENIANGVNERLVHIGSVLRRAGLTVTDGALTLALSLTESDYTRPTRTDLMAEEAIDRAIRILKARSPGVPTALLDAVAVVVLAVEIAAAYEVLADRALRAASADAAPVQPEPEPADPLADAPQEVAPPKKPRAKKP